VLAERFWVDYVVGFRFFILMLMCHFQFNIYLVFSILLCSPIISKLLCILRSPFNGVSVSYRCVGGIVCNKSILLWIRGHFTGLQSVVTNFDRK